MMNRLETAAHLKVPSLWLLATAVLTLAPHSTHLPVWLSGLCALILLARGWMLFHPEVRIHRAIVILLALTVAFGIRQDFGHFFGKDPGVALLAVLLCLKQLEIGAHRDIRAAVLLSFFLQLGLFFYDQSLPVAAMALTGTLFATIALLTLQTGGNAVRDDLRTGGLLFMQSIPFLLVLFMLFPRIPGPLWGLPADAYSAMSGLSETMAPGSISQLGLSDAIAFRAQFSDTPPPPAQRYWRGPVLTQFDGRTWRAANFISQHKPAYETSGTALAYRLTLEPHNQRWLLALEFPGSVAEDVTVTYTSDHQLLAARPIRSRSRFDLQSYPDTIVGRNEASTVLASATRLPANSNPRAVALGRELRRQSGSPEAALEQVVARMSDMALTYTLRPPLLGAHPVDEFLFDSQRGFCEHFASAFVVLMRAADVPARVVTGYQGGEINPVDGSLVVRQSDAHAWAEVWLAERGWVRIDPTALAAPSRIESGLASALPRGETLPFMMRPALSWLRDVRHQWEALSNTWNQVVLGYNADGQYRLLERLGFSSPDWRSLIGLLAGSSVALLLALFAWAFRQSRRHDPIDRSWSRFCAKMARKGLPRLPWEGPIDYAERLASTHPDSATALREIANTYARLRYGAGEFNTALTMRLLTKRIRDFKLK